MFGREAPAPEQVVFVGAGLSQEVSDAEPTANTVQSGQAGARARPGGCRRELPTWLLSSTASPKTPRARPRGPARDREVSRGSQMDP